jgi:hypothetical protein
MSHSFPLIRPVGHLLPQGEWISGESELIRLTFDFRGAKGTDLVILKTAVHCHKKARRISRERMIMPHRTRVLVLEWASEHRAELMEDWELCARMQTPKKISSLK